MMGLSATLCIQKRVASASWSQSWRPCPCFVLPFCGQARRVEWPRVPMLWAGLFVSGFQGSASTGEGAFPSCVHEAACRCMQIKIRSNPGRGSVAVNRNPNTHRHIVHAHRYIDPPRGPAARGVPAKTVPAQPKVTSSQSFTFKVTTAHGCAPVFISVIQISSRIKTASDREKLTLCHSTSDSLVSSYPLSPFGPRTWLHTRFSFQISSRTYRIATGTNKASSL